MSLDDASALLSRPIREAVAERFGSLTEPQQLAIPHILKGDNVLLMAPTGTGKTEAALLPIFSKMIYDPSRAKISLLYITPLRALNRDLLERVDWWCQKLDLKAVVRHGDTTVKERRAHTLIPPDLMITTPEALQSLLIGRVIKRYLANVKWVIVDEVHELASDKRGSQLSVGLKRLRRITGRDFQIIGLSATVGSADKVASFLVGVGGSCKVLRVPVARRMDVRIVFPQPEGVDSEIADMLGVAPDVAARLRTIKQLVDAHSSTLIFTNTRPLAEILSNRFKAWSETYPISIHHGSLSRDRRIDAERELKHGKLAGIICTSSLEMGIDVGRVDLCIQYNSPREASRLLQRVGRSGHRVDGLAKGVIIVMDSDDALEAMVIARRVRSEQLEPTEIPLNSLDVIMHQVAGLLIEEGKISIDEVLDLLRGSYNFSELTREELLEVSRFMSSIGIARFDQSSGDLYRPANQKRLYDYYFSNLSMIPEERQYLVVDEDKGEAVGILDESFVAEYGEPGTRFILGGRPWIILSMSGDRIYVAPLTEGEGAVPSWVGDEIPVPPEVASEVGEIRRRYVELRGSGLNHVEASSILARDYGVAEADMSRSLREVAMHLELGIPVPNDRLAVLEKAGDFLILHIHGGLKINRTLARVLSTSLGEWLGAPISSQSDPYRVVLRSRHLEPELVLSVMRDMDFDEVFDRAVESSGIFKRRLVHVARKMGVIGREASIIDVKMQQFIESLKETPVYLEALRYTKFSDFDGEGARAILKRISSGDLEVRIYRTQTPSPLASLTINRYLYEFESYNPEKLHRVVLNAVRGRLMSERVTLLCVDCYSYSESVEVGELGKSPTCKDCGSRKLGLLKKTGEELSRLLARRGRASSREELRIKREAERTARLIEKYGKAAAVVLAGREITYKVAEDILKEESQVSPRLIELIIEAEKKRLLDLFR